MTEHQTSGPPIDAPPPAPPAPRRVRPPFQRSGSDKVIAGVAGGLARSLEIDAVVVRIVLVLLAVTFPTVVVAYLAAAILVRADHQPGGRAVGAVVLRDGGDGLWVVTGVVVVVAVVMLGLGNDVIPGVRFLPLALVGIGVALWSRDGSNDSASAGAAPPHGGWPPADAGTTPSQASHGGPSTLTPWPGQRSADGVVPPLPPSGTGVPPGRSSRPARPPRSRLGPVTLALALIAAGVVAALDAAGTLYARPTEIAAVALLVIGMGLIVGSVIGRAKWLVLVALLLLPPVVFGTLLRELPIVTDVDIVTDARLSDGVGERRVVVRGTDELPDDVRLMAGSIDMDLAVWDPTSAQIAQLDDSQNDLSVDVGAGEVIVRVPSTVAWQVSARIGLGEVIVLNEAGEMVSNDSTERVGSSLTQIASGGPQGGPVLDIVVDMTLGQLTVRLSDPIQTTEELS